MRKCVSAMALFALGVMIVGCESSDDSRGIRQEGNYSTEQAKEPYSPIPGDTTGGGLRRDRRTGAEIAPGSTTGDEKIRDQDRMRGNPQGPVGPEGTDIKNPPSGNGTSPSTPGSLSGNGETSR